MNYARALTAAFLLITASPVLVAEEAKAVEKTVVDTEMAQLDILEKAQALTSAGKPAEAIVLIDQALAYYENKYPEGDTRWYVSRTGQETVAYLVGATIFPAKTGKKDAVVLISAWAEAYFQKAYAYVELQQAVEAKAALGKALMLSPKNAKYLIEFAEIAKLERDWNTAYDYYKEAEAASAVSPPETKSAELSHAKRGQAFVFIEQGKLDEAEKVLKECLKLDKNDQRAKEELEYIEKLRK